jgi:hypothetical protein
MVSDSETQSQIVQGSAPLAATSSNKAFARECNPSFLANSAIKNDESRKTAWKPSTAPIEQILVPRSDLVSLLLGLLLGLGEKRDPLEDPARGAGVRSNPRRRHYVERGLASPGDFHDPIRGPGELRCQPR